MKPTLWHPLYNRLLNSNFYMELELYQKDNKVCTLCLNENYEILSITQVFDSNRMPTGTFKSEYQTISAETDFHKFKVWWKSRFIPSDRKYLKKALELLRLASVDELVSKTHCASLNDQYWTKQTEDNSTWSDINFFTNEFDDSVGLVLLLNREKNFSEKSYNNPDFTTDGALPKRWIIEGGKRYLIKGTESAFMQEPFNEYLAHILCTTLGIHNVSYQVLQTKNNEGETEYLSKCENFVTENTEFVPAYFIKETVKKTNNESDYQHFLRCCDALGAKNIEPDLTRMLFADFIMANTDRHYRNFGLIRKTDTLEWIGLAPVFDTERSMFLTKMMPKQDYEAINIEAKPFKDNQAEQFNLLKKEYLTNLPLEKASDTVPLFSSILELNELIPSERRIALCKTLEARISEAVSLVKEDRKIKITKSRQQRELDRLNTLNSLVVLC